VSVTAGKPIPVSDLLERAEIPAKGGSLELTALLERELSAMLGQ
jgi:hypothetical protein